MIYFIQAGKNGAIKIGYTESDISGRVASLQTASPEELHLLGSMEGDIQKESELHEKFADNHIRGEWFKPTIALKAFIFENTHEDLSVPSKTILESNINLDEILGTIEYNYIRKALEITENNKMRAAELLGISFRTFRYRLGKHKMQDE